MSGIVQLSQLQACSRIFSELSISVKLVEGM